jgi:SAM-dependent methyltransferase
MKASNPKTVLVICSTVSGSDFPKNENQTMLKQLLGDDFIAEFMGQYPDDLPTDKKFDAVLFAGCNLLMWLFYKAHEDGMEKLYNILKQDGIVIFVESQNYINKTVTKGKSYGLSIPIEEMKLYGLKQYNDSEIKQKILKSWGKFFHLDQMEHYFVYKKNDEF